MGKATINPLTQVKTKQALKCALIKNKVLNLNQNISRKCMMKKQAQSMKNPEKAIQQR